MRWSGVFFYRVILDRSFTSQLSSPGASLPHKTTRYDGFRVYRIDRLLLGGSGRKKPLWNGRLMLHRNAANLRNIWGPQTQWRWHVVYTFCFVLFSQRQKWVHHLNQQFVKTVSSYVSDAGFTSEDLKRFGKVKCLTPAHVISRLISSV